MFAIGLDELDPARADRASPAFPQPPTPGYIVYLGRQSSHHIGWPGGGAQVENFDEGAERQLHMTVT
jgi:hypothetical protein